MCSDRLIELIHNDEIQMARTLAIGIRQNDTLIDINELDDSVKIEYTHFVGIHDVKIVDGGDKVINSKGIYKLKSNQVNFEMEFNNIQKNVRKKAYDVINERDKEETNIEPDKKINPEENQNMNLLTRFLSIF